MRELDKDLVNELIDVLWDSLDYINCGPTDREQLEKKIRNLINALKY